MLIEFTWSAPEGSASFLVPGERETWLMDDVTGPDPDALNLLQAAGFHLDQIGGGGPSGEAAIRIASGQANADDLADAIWRAMNHATTAMTIAARSLPVRITELPGVLQPVLVLGSEPTGSVQVPIERDAIRRALEATTEALAAADVESSD